MLPASIAANSVQMASPSPLPVDSRVSEPSAWRNFSNIFSLSDSATPQPVSVTAIRIIRDSELDSVLPAALELTRNGTPALVEVVIDYSQKTYFTKGVVKTIFSRLSWGDRVANISRAVGRRIL